MRPKVFGLSFKGYVGHECFWLYKVQKLKGMFEFPKWGVDLNSFSYSFLHLLFGLPRCMEYGDKTEMQWLHFPPNIERMSFSSRVNCWQGYGRKLFSSMLTISNKFLHLFRERFLNFLKKLQNLVLPKILGFSKFRNAALRRTSVNNLGFARCYLLYELLDRAV